MLGMVMTTMRTGVSVHDALMGMLDALVGILYGFSVFVRWFSMMIGAGVNEGLW